MFCMLHKVILYKNCWNAQHTVTTGITIVWITYNIEVIVSFRTYEFGSGSVLIIFVQFSAHQSWTITSIESQFLFDYLTKSVGSGRIGRQLWSVSCCRNCFVSVARGSIVRGSWKCFLSSCHRCFYTLNGTLRSTDSETLTYKTPSS